MSNQIDNDPTGDELHQVLPGVIHRYSRKILVILTNKCAGKCPFCFRKESELLPLVDEYWAEAQNWLNLKQYILDHPKINEIIFSGGDPWMIDSHQLQILIDNLIDIEQLKKWRWHTRVPFFQPNLLQSEWWDVWGQLAAKKKQIVVFHLNHQSELTDELILMSKKIISLGGKVWAQGVLLQNVNDKKGELAALWLKETINGIKPYYLHHLDKAPGIEHFRVSIDEGLSIFCREKVLFGYNCRKELPLKYVVELPEGGGKFEVAELKKVTANQYLGLNLNREEVLYDDICEVVNE